jgi:hypothetical protein
MPIERESIRKSIQEKGFKPDPARTNQDHDYYFLEHDGKLLGGIWIRLSRGHGYKEYSENLIGRQARILKLTYRFLFDFFICKNLKQDMIKALTSSGRLHP